MRTPRVVDLGAWWLGLLLGCVPLAAAPPEASPALPELNQKVLDYSRTQLGKKVGDGSCATLAVVALGRAGATRYPLEEDGDDLAWGTEVKSTKDVLPGDVVQLRNAVFKGRTALSRGRTRVWSFTYPRHTAIVTGVSNGGKVVAILHQNVGPEEADVRVKQIVQAGTLRMDALQSGGIVRFYRPVPARSLLPRTASAGLAVVQGAFPANLGSGWSWAGEPAITWRVEQGMLAIRPKAGAVRKGTSATEARLVRVLPRPGDEVYSVEVTVDGRSSDPLEYAGLVCAVGDDRQVLLVTRSEPGKDGFVQLHDRRESDADDSRLKAECPAQSVRFRMLVSGDAVTGQYRTELDGWWETIGRFPLPKRTELSVGVVAGFGPQSAKREIRFRDPRIVRMSSRRPEE